MKYFEEARQLWRTHVPPRGQSDTVEGELIRAVEKLRDEAQRNGNVNWRPDHELLASFIRDTLVGSEIFDVDAIEEIHADVEALIDFEHPVTSDEPYDRLADRIVEWSHSHRDPVPHQHRADLNI
jgi:hypothetical protein